MVVFILIFINVIILLNKINFDYINKLIFKFDNTILIWGSNWKGFTPHIQKDWDSEVNFILHVHDHFSLLSLRIKGEEILLPGYWYFCHKFNKNYI